MYTHTKLLPTREDLEQATAEHWAGPNGLARAGFSIGPVYLTIHGDDIPLLAATLHRLADELTAAQDDQTETVYSEAQAATL